MKFEGCFVAIVTPFSSDGTVDYKALQAHASWMVEEGVSGIVVAGTTGESATLNDEEKLGSMNAVWDAVSERAVVVGGAGNNCTSESLAFIDRVNTEAKVHAIMSVVPYYNKPNQRGIIGHFDAILGRSKNPVVLYNVPGRTVVGMTVDTMAELATRDPVVAIKEASADLHANAKLLPRLNGVSLLSGDDATTMPFVAQGGHGTVSVVGNVAPRLMSEMCAAAASGDLETARRHNFQVAHLHDLMFRYPNPLPAKAVVSQLGFGGASVRLPLAQLDEAELRGVLADATKLEVTR
ncbi:MAG: 4-hydroxy-tetrahydrodipicolinate synthase [Bradymonadia bacterium]|jgi:4-hydroxy-tetrahydrodipicolinate synthase